MKVYTFNKSVKQRYDYACLALKFEDGIVSATEMHASWRYYLSALVEPGGWQAIWRLSRVLCEELQVRYPTIVFGTVDHVHFAEGTAQFTVQAVPDSDINMQLDTHYANLEDVWVTIAQENQALDLEKTAEAIDNYRFFMRNIFFPWDPDYDDSTIDFMDTHFVARAKLYCDMQNKRMSRNSLARLKLMIAEAQDLGLKRYRLEAEVMSDDEDGDDEELDDKVPVKGKKKELLQINLRMGQIKAEFDILENPIMRQVFEEKERLVEKPVQNVIVTKPAPIPAQSDYLSAVKDIMGKDENVVIESSLQHALMVSPASSTIYIPHTLQKVKFPLALDESGMIKSIPDDTLKAIIAPKEDEQVLFVCGNYRFENITLDCRNVETGLLILDKATVTLKNCELIGNKQSSTHQGIFIREEAKLILEDCRLIEHVTGISLSGNAELVIRNSQFRDCGTGIVATGDNYRLSIEDTSFKNMDHHGIMLHEMSDEEMGDKTVYNEFSELTTIPSSISFAGRNTGSLCIIKNALNEGKIHIIE